MLKTHGMRQQLPRAIFYATLLCLLLVQVTYAAEGGKCSSGTSFYCPNCGGQQVEDCLDCDGYLSTDTVHDICFDRKLFQKNNEDPDDPDNHYHYLWNDLVGMVVWFFTAGVATACGVGGGGIYVPLGILLFQFAPKQASGLSQASIFGASCGGLLLNSKNRHPNKKIRDEPGEHPSKETRQVQTPHPQAEQDYEQRGGTYYTRPLINYDMALFLAPMEMAGAVLGVLVQKILPNWLYLLIAGLVLSITSYKTYGKYFAVRKKEKAAEAETAAKEEEEEEDVKEVDTGVAVDDDDDKELEQAEQGTTDDSEDSNKTPPEDDDETPPEEEEAVEMDVKDVDLAPEKEELEDEDEDNDEDDEQTALLRKEYLEEDMRQYPRDKILALLILWIGLFLLTLMKGGKGVESLVGIDCESPVYAVLIVLQFLWMFGFAIYFGIQLVKKQSARVHVYYPYMEDDPEWNTKTLRFYGFWTFIAGVVAGLIGIGGGMVLGPLMLLMGIHPRVSSATTATMIVLTSSSVAVIFVTSGLVPWSYAVFYFCVCFSGAIIGKMKIDGYVKRTGRASLLILILATIIALATLGCFVILLTRLADKDWCLDGFNQFCNIEDEASCAANRFLNEMARVTSGGAFQALLDVSN